MTRQRENRIEVPGTPEQVWEMIATGHGIEAWFVPAEVEPRVGGRVGLDIMGTGVEDAGTVTAWEPPRRFEYEEEWQQPAGRLATEFLVEAQSGGTCVVRLVTTLHAEDGDWDQILDNLQAGWDGYLLILRLYLEHYAGRRCTTITASAHTEDPAPAAFASLLAGLGLEDPTLGERVESASGPRLAGIVEYRGEDGLIVRIDEPAPGVALLFAFGMPGGTLKHAHLYLFGETDDGEAEAWREWMASNELSRPSGAART